MISDPTFDGIMGDILHDTAEEAVILEDVHENQVIESPAIISFCNRLVGMLPAMWQSLHTKHPDARYPEAVLGLVQMSWDYGFRAGRIFQARGYAVPGEDTFEEDHHA